MPRLELKPFSEEAIGEAGALLAARHRRQREREPLLPARYGDADAAAAEVAALWQADGASGSVAVRGDRITGFLLGVRRRDDVWGANVWIELAGHAADEAEDVRDLYAAAAAHWVEEGRPRHYAIVPASDPELVQAWFRLGFGQQHAYGIRELPGDTPWPEGVREAKESDVDALVELTPVLQDYQSGSPVFSAGGPQPDEEELRREIREDIVSPQSGNLVAERSGRIVGALDVVPVEMSSMHVNLARPEGVAFLSWAATVPEERGTGAGLALTAAGFAWARARGYSAMVVDWRVTNLLSSRFWPRRGFRTTFLRLYRSIP